MEWQSVYEAYPVNRELIWLNNCGTTPAGNHIVQAVSCALEGYARRGVLMDPEAYGKVRTRIKEILSGLLGCRPEELALIHNTAEGMNFISHGLTLTPGDEIILLENEYPSNVYPWRHWEKKGVRLMTAPMKDSPQAFLESLSAVVTKKTRVMALSLVHWCTGMPLPVEQIGRLCRDAKIELVMDGAQGVGMQPVDVKQAGISYMAFSAWKWLLGPLGLGVLYVAQDRLDRLDPIFMGTESVVRDEEYLPYKSELKPTADRFTISTANFGDWVYFLAALEFLDAIGFEKARKRILELAAHLNAGLRKIGFEVFSDRFSHCPTGIVVCSKPGVPASNLMGFLHQNGIVAAERLDRIRFSPHVYILPGQLDRVVEVLSRT